MSDVTDELLSGFDEEESAEEIEEDAVGVEEIEQPEREEVVVADEPETADVQAETEAETEDEAEDEGEEEQTDEDEQEGDEKEDEDEDGFKSDDPAVKAYLAKYQGDVERALKAASRVNDALARQGYEKNQLTQRIGELENALSQAQVLNSGSQILNQEQRDWVDEAVGSGRPTAYVQQAIQAGEYELARAVCATWAQEQPYEALRVSQAVDQAEWTQQQQSYEAQEQNGNGTLDRDSLMEIIVDNFPDMPQYEGQMVTTLNSLGEMHPLVQDARSTDPQVAARGIIGVYEIARASSATVKQARDQVGVKRREAAAAGRRKGAVASQGATPSPGETPAATKLGAGLTLEQLDAEWDTRR